ncbi:MAG: hypothetical protein N2482_01520, partial [Patescibacteria group bacterium]|nr:hypothetical protein [Patescibacteria group bacterium]
TDTDDTNVVVKENVIQALKKIVEKNGFDSLEANLDKENIDKLKREPTKARIKRNKYIDRYNKFLEQLAKIRDWRRYVMYHGIPKGCTGENTTIPDTEGALNQNEDEPSNILPDIFQIDPDLIS